MLRAAACAGAGLFLLSGLAACSGAGRVSHVEQTALYSSATMGFAAKDGVLATEVRGQPFTSGPVVAEEVAAAMKPPGWHRAFRFSTAQLPGRATDYRLILRFNAPTDGISGEMICGGAEPGPGGAVPAGTAVHGVFCVGPRLVSEARAATGPIRAPDDPAFRGLTDALLAELMPAYNRQVPIDTGSCSEC